MASRRFGDPVNARSSGDRFGRVPAWIIRSLKWKPLSGSESKLLIYLACIMDNSTNMTPGFTITDLADALSLHRNTASDALRNLTCIGIVAQGRSKRGKLCVQVLFQDPDTPRQDNET